MRKRINQSGGVATILPGRKPEKIPMKSVRIHGFYETAVIDDIPVPTIAADQVLVRIKAAALNPLDIGLMTGWAAQFFPITFPYIVGTDFAGVIEKVGDAVVDFQPGDAVVVWADPLTGGALSEYAAVSAAQCVSKPSVLSFEDGAAIPTAGSTAWHGLFSAGKLQAGETVLIHAAAGGVGMFAVQFAKQAGARVLATASGHGVELVRSLGADDVVDYRQQDFAKAFAEVDLVLDLVGDETQMRSYEVLKAGGRLISVKTPPDEAVADAHGVTAAIFYAKPFSSRLGEVVAAVAGDGVRTVVDTSVPLDRFEEAIERQTSGHARGKIIVSLG